jgi:valyl-tRNA synthetase
VGLTIATVRPETMLADTAVAVNPDDERYRDLIGPWFEYLIVSPDEMAEIVEGTGWEIRHLIRDEDSVYVAVLEHPG